MWPKAVDQTQLMSWPSIIPSHSPPRTANSQIIDHQIGDSYRQFYIHWNNIYFYAGLWSGCVKLSAQSDYNFTLLLTTRMTLHMYGYVYIMLHHKILWFKMNFHSTKFVSSSRSSNRRCHQCTQGTKARTFPVSGYNIQWMLWLFITMGS